MKMMHFRLGLISLLLFISVCNKAQEPVPFKSNMIRVNAGYALTGTSKENFSPWGKNYGSKIMGGTALHFNYSHLWQRSNKNKGLGIGMEYQIISASSKTYFLKNTGDAVKDKITSHYIAPQLVTTYRFAKDLSFDVNYGIGYRYYYNNGRKNDKSCVTKGSGFGVNIAFNFEYYVAPTISVTAGANATAGFFGKLHQTFEGKKETIDLNSEYDFNPTYADFTIGIRYHW